MLRIKSSGLAAFLMLMSVTTLTACSSGGYGDIDEFMARVKEKPAGHIKPIPIFKPYKVFKYNATAMRAPFEVPVKIREIAMLALSSNVKPDENRIKEQLESFNFEALSMVGTLERNSQLWVLIDDGDGGVHQVGTGNFLGKNHGRIVKVDYESIGVIEIVPNGVDGWIERPRTLKLKSSD